MVGEASCGLEMFFSGRDWEIILPLSGIISGSIASRMSNRPGHTLNYIVWTGPSIYFKLSAKCPFSLEISQDECQINSVHIYNECSMDMVIRHNC